MEKLYTVEVADRRGSGVNYAMRWSVHIRRRGTKYLVGVGASNDRGRAMRDALREVRLRRRHEAWGTKKHSEKGVGKNG